MASLCGSSWAPFMRWRPIRKVMLKETERLLEKNAALTPSLTFHKKSGSYEDLRSGSLHPDTPMTPKEEDRYGFVRLGSLRGSRKELNRTVELLGTNTLMTLEDTVEKPSETIRTPTKSIPSVDSSVMKTPLSSQSMDSVLHTASLEKPALGLGVPMLVVRSYQPFAAKPGECNRNSDVAVKRGEPVIALFARGEWLFVRTVQCQQGFVPRHCCDFRWNTDNSTDALHTPTDDDVSPPHVYEPIVTVSRLKLDLSRLNVSGEGSSDSGFSSPSLCQDPKDLRRLRTRSRKPVCMKDKTSLSLTQMELDVTATPRVSLCGLSDLQLSSIQGTPQWRPIDQEEEDDELSIELIEKDSLRCDDTIEQCDEEQEEEEESAHEVTILFGYEAAFCGDLAVNCGERVQMLPSNHPEWLRVRNSSGREGFIPRTHIVDLNSLKKSPFVAKHTAL